MVGSLAGKYRTLEHHPIPDSSTDLSYDVGEIVSRNVANG